MTVIDTLQVLVEADARGIEATLKKVVSIAEGTVGNINKQEVDWTSIFTRSVSPAIIGGIASMFAFAIEQSLNFSNALNQTGTAAGDSTQQIAQLSQGALNLSQKVPASAQDIANAMVQVSAIFGNVADQQEVVQAMSELSASGFGDLNDIVKESVDIFQQWGVTTTQQAIDVLTELMHGAEGAKESLPAFAQQIGQISPYLRQAGIQLGSLNGIVATFSSEIKNVGSASALQIFQSIAAGASDASSPIAIFGGGVEAIRKSLMTNGGLDTIKQLSNVFSSEFGNNVGLIAKNFGITATEVEGLVNSGKKFPTIASDSKNIATNTQSIAEAYDQSSSSLRNLTLLWNHFKADAIKAGTTFEPLVDGLAGALNTMLTDTDSFFHDLTDGFGNVLSPIFGNDIKSAFSGALKDAGNMYDTFVNKLPSQTMNGISGVFGGTDYNPLNSRLQGTGIGFSQSILSRIDAQASQTGLLDSLVSALQTNIKSGQYTQLVNTFHLSVPAGSQGLTAKMIAQQLYNQFQGTSGW